MTSNPRDDWPADSIAAVVHPDPYPHYRHVAGRPIEWHEGLGMWVAASAADVSAVLTHPAARVRPVGQLVPGGFADTLAGDVFGRLVRMNDRSDRAHIKDAIVAAIGRVTPTMLDAAAVASADRLAGTATFDGAFLDRWCAEFPIGVVARLIGVDDLDAAIPSARVLAACFGPVPPDKPGEVASVAVSALEQLVVSAEDDGSGLAANLAESVGADRAADAVANLIGLFFQTFDSTSGQIGLELARLARGASVVEPSLHNTRRFFAEAADIGGAHIGDGDIVLVVLAAASVPFGAGAHRCPASALVPEIVSRAVRALLEIWPDALEFARPTGYRPLPNSRVPVFS